MNTLDQLCMELGPGNAVVVEVGELAYEDDEVRAWAEESGVPGVGLTRVVDVVQIDGGQGDLEDAPDSDVRLAS